jgi:hypothetical protein
MKPLYSRRHFLSKSVAAVAWALGAVGSRSLALETRPPPEEPQPSETQEDTFAYLPFVSQAVKAVSTSKLGIHTIRPDGAEAFVRQVRAAGAHVALVKGLDDLGYLQIVKEVSPETICVARREITGYSGIDAQGDPVAKARDYMDQHMAWWEADRESVDYWEVLNEPDPPGEDGHAWLGDFFIACMDIAEENEYVLALFSYSVGVPEWEEWQAVVATGVFERAKAGGHILALHEYSWPNMDRWWGGALPGHPVYPDRGILAGRYRHLYEDFLIPRDQVIPLAVTEAGYDPSIFGEGWDGDWKNRYVEEMAWYDSKMLEDDYVIGCALFTLGGVGVWQDWDYEDVLPEMAAYIISLLPEDGI